jgi:inhibitor of KinA
MLISPLGDSALRVQLGEKMDESTLVRVQSACVAIAAAAVPGVVELVPAYTTVIVHYDPLAVARAAGECDLADWLGARVREAVARGGKTKLEKRAPVEVAVCYGGDFGPDLARVAARAKLSPEEVVRRHAKAEYRVALVGFAPGFPYLLGLPSELATPRLAKPRTSVPAGSVGIAGEQTGIYPLATPGGWNLIGRAAVRLFDPQQDPPVRLQAGDRVKFRAVSREEFAQLEGRA